ncbi:MAG: hypothetical protein JW722_03125 [Demequinaceae bacterium]|nr:hypothetical protein [Demequinaceae bacterium]
MHLKPGVPILVREAGRIQVGLAEPLVFDGLSDEEGAFLASLEGRRVGLSRAERAAHGKVIEALDRHGVLVPSEPSPGRARSLIRVHGVGPITGWLAIGLALGGISALSIVDPRPRQLAAIGPGFPHRGDAASLNRLIREVEPTIRMAEREEHASLEVLCAHGATDIVLARQLTARDVPHLDIVTDEGGITVGPLIVPGATPCETCLGMFRTEREPWWPRIALQFGDPRRDAGLEAPPAASLMAAGIALKEILAHVDGTAPSAQRWRIPFEGTAASAESCAAHPACGCGAAPPSDPPGIGARLVESRNEPRDAWAPP